jgi:hypothetical protein
MQNQYPGAFRPAQALGKGFCLLGSGSYRKAYKQREKI